MEFFYLIRFYEVNIQDVSILFDPSYAALFSDSDDAKLVAFSPDEPFRNSE